MLYPVSEIFYSIQGEGYHAGKPAVFIRLAGCNLKCPWCDTDHSKKFDMEAKKIALKTFNLFPAGCFLFVIITGGEPTIHNLEELTRELKKFDMFVAIETNGVLENSLSFLLDQDLVDWITFSPKSDNIPTNNTLMRVNEIKIVFDGVIKPGAFDKFTRCKIMRGCCFIQPCSEDYQPAVDFVLKNPQWRLSIQTQKVIGVK